MGDRQQMQGAWKAVLGVGLCSVLWGSAFPAIKYVYALWGEQGVDISLWTRWWFAGVRFVLAGGALLLLSRNVMAQYRATSKRYLIAMMLCQTVSQYIFFYWALIYGSGSLCALLTATGSFWWILLAPFFGAASWGGWRVWGVLLLGAVGVALAVYSPSDPSRSAPLGIGLMLCATLSGSLAVLLFGKVKPTMNAMPATGVSLFIGGLCLCGVGAPAIGDSAVLFTSPVMGCTVYLAMVSATAFTIWNELSTRYPIALLATYRFMIPIVGLGLSVLFIPEESLTMLVVFGACTVALAMALANRL